MRYKVRPLARVFVSIDQKFHLLSPKKFILFRYVRQLLLLSKSVELYTDVDCAVWDSVQIYVAVPQSRDLVQKTVLGIHAICDERMTSQQSMLGTSNIVQNGCSWTLWTTVGEVVYIKALTGGLFGTLPLALPCISSFQKQLRRLHVAAAFWTAAQVPNAEAMP